MSRFTMRRLKVLITLLAALATSFGLAPVSMASASSAQVIADCSSTGHLSGSYSRGQLQSALNGMGADTKEYTNCYDVVRRALLASAAAGGGHSGGSSGSTGKSASNGAGTKSSRHNAGVSTRGVYSTAPDAAAAGKGSSRAVQLGGSRLHPGGTGIDTSSSVRSLPAPLIGVLVLLGLAALSGGGLALRRRVIARHGG